MTTAALVPPEFALPAAKVDEVEEVEGDPILLLRAALSFGNFATFANFRSAKASASLQTLGTFALTHRA